MSAGVLITERDLTNIVPAVSTSVGAFAGAFAWGPVMDPVLVSSENELVSIFGKPTDGNFTSFLSAANFLSYSNSLYVCRAEGDGALNAVVSGTAVAINNRDAYDTTYANGAGIVGEFAAKYPGAIGNSILVSMADTGMFATWVYKDEFDSAPSTSTYVSNAGGSSDELHIIVIDQLGLITGVKGNILEKFAYVSKASDARKADGTNNYYKDVLNNTSRYIYWMDHPAIVDINWGTTAAGKTFTAMTAAITATLIGGVDDFAPSAGNVQDAFKIFDNSEVYDISLIVTGAVTPVVSKYVVDNVADVRKDCVVFISPSTDTGGVITGVSAAAILADTLEYRTTDLNVDSSYAVLDSGWKYQYDRYNDKYRWIPLNGDIAGLCARTDYTNDSWWSPGGFNRGQIKNVVKLSFNPNQAQRDQLYKIGVNPVVSFPGTGTVLYGDKTLLSKPSAFDRINVRRLFITLEKAIATAAKYTLFEFNDSFTRAQFKSMVEPFLRDVQGRRGIIEFRVVCDDTNNTGEVIDRNEFIGDIYIKPTRSINFITLNFIAARTSVSFDEIGG